MTSSASRPILTHFLLGFFLQETYDAAAERALWETNGTGTHDVEGAYPHALIDPVLA